MAWFQFGARKTAAHIIIKCNTKLNSKGKWAMYLIYHHRIIIVVTVKPTFYMYKPEAVRVVRSPSRHYYYTTPGCSLISDSPTGMILSNKTSKQSNPRDRKIVINTPPRNVAASPFGRLALGRVCYWLGNATQFKIAQLKKCWMLQWHVRFFFSIWRTRSPIEWNRLHLSWTWTTRSFALHTINN